MKHVTALILAGGLGTRLRPVIADKPKVLAPIHGRPFLAYLLDRLDAAGITAAVLCTGYMADQVERTFGERYRGIDLRYSVESTPLGTGGAMRLALDHIQTEDVLAFNGDSFVDVDLRRLEAFHQQRRPQLSMVLTQVPDTQRYGRVVLGADGVVEQFQEKGARVGPGWINAGVYRTRGQLLASIPPDQVVSLERQVLPHYINGGLVGFCGGGRFLDIGTPQSYALAESFFRDWNPADPSVNRPTGD